jgi:hypothetical protein
MQVNAQPADSATAGEKCGCPHSEDAVKRKLNLASAANGLVHVAQTNGQL